MGNYKQGALQKLELQLSTQEKSYKSAMLQVFATIGDN